MNDYERVSGLVDYVFSKDGIFWDAKDRIKYEICKLLQQKGGLEMGYQKGCDTSQEEYNRKAQASAQQRTSVTREKAKDTTHAQYGRLRGGGKPVGTGE